MSSPKLAFSIQVSEEGSKLIAYGDSMDDLFNAILESNNKVMISEYIDAFTLTPEKWYQVYLYLDKWLDSHEDLPYFAFHIIEKAFSQEVLVESFWKLANRGNERQIERLKEILQED